MSQPSSDQNWYLHASINWVAHHQKSIQESVIFRLDPIVWSSSADCMSQSNLKPVKTSNFSQWRSCNISKSPLESKQTHTKSEMYVWGGESYNHNRSEVRFLEIHKRITFYFCTCSAGFFKSLHIGTRSFHSTAISLSLGTTLLTGSSRSARVATFHHSWHWSCHSLTGTSLINASFHCSVTVVISLRASHISHFKLISVITSSRLGYRSNCCPKIPCTIPKSRSICTKFRPVTSAWTSKRIGSWKIRK